MSTEYGKAIYRQRKGYFQQYYQDNKAELKLKAQERNKAKKHMKVKQQEQEYEGIKAMICDDYCRHIRETYSEGAMEELCDNCSLMARLDAWKTER